MCYKCAGPHEASKCNCETLKCANCDYSNKEYKTTYNVNHSVIASDLCEILKNKIKRYIEATDYPLQTTYKRYFGKVETTKQTMKMKRNLQYQRLIQRQHR